MICSNAELHLATVWQPTVEGFAQTITHLSFAVHAFVLYSDSVAFNSYSRVSLACAACKQSNMLWQPLWSGCHATAGRLCGTTDGNIVYLTLRWLGLLVEMQSMHKCCAVRTHDQSDVKSLLVPRDLAGDLSGCTSALQCQGEAQLSNGCG